MGRTFRLVSYAVILIFVGCHNVVRVYEGPRRPTTEIATITIGANVKLLEIDDMPIQGKIVEALPGPHAIHFRITARFVELGKKDTDQRTYLYCDGELVAEVGNSYRIVREKPKELRSVKVGFERYTFHQVNAHIVEIESGLRARHSKVECFWPKHEVRIQW
jgi:hypothetical protein